MSSRNSYNQHPKKINYFFHDQYFKTYNKPKQDARITGIVLRSDSIVDNPIGTCVVSAVGGLLT
jgi:hypothetical protein